jgi:gag-polyprotein putative aspartyl protease
MNVIENDYTDVTRLDEHFAARREQELKLEADAQKAQHEAAMVPLHSERIRKMGLAALAAGAGVGLALFGASFLIAPNTRVVTVTKEVPGPERVVTVNNEVPGPERVVTVTKEVPGPERVVTVTKEVPGPERVVTKEVPGPERVVVKEVPGPERVIHDAPVPPVGPESTSQNCSTMDGKSSYPCNKPSTDAPKTSDEQKFTDKPGYKDAPYNGRIVKSIDGNALSFADGKNLWPYHWDEPAHKAVPTPDVGFDSDELVGDLAMCTTDEHDLTFCRAMHNGQEVGVHGKPAVKSASATPPAPCPLSLMGLPTLVCDNAPKPTTSNDKGPVTSATDMVKVMVDVDGYPVTAMVDTGCSWPMSIPEALADLLVNQHRAARTTPAKSTLADGSVQDTQVVVLDYVTVDGRHLRDVVAAIAPNGAPILLGLGALNRLGRYAVTDGRLVFTGAQPS